MNVGSKSSKKLNYDIKLVENETVINNFKFIKAYTHYNLWNYKGLYNMCFHFWEEPTPIEKESGGVIINE